MSEPTTPVAAVSVIDSGKGTDWIHRERLALASNSNVFFRRGSTATGAAMALEGTLVLSAVPVAVTDCAADVVVAMVTT